MITVKEQVCSVESQIHRLRIYLGTFPLSIHRSYSVVMDIKLCRQRAQEGHCRKERANFWSWQAGFAFYFAAQAEPVVSACGVESDGIRQCPRARSLAGSRGMPCSGPDCDYFCGLCARKAFPACPPTRQDGWEAHQISPSSTSLQPACFQAVSSLTGRGSSLVGCDALVPSLCTGAFFTAGFGELWSAA